MKILHTSDWHIGKVVKEMSMLSDQKYIFDEMINIIEEENIDAVIVAGDLYDRSIAPVEAVELLDNIFNTIIVKKNIPIIAIAGNHDSPERIGFGSNILREKGLYIEGCIKKEIRKITLNESRKNINFYLVPYADPAYIRNLYGDDNIKNHEDAMKKVLDKIHESLNEEEINILISHGYVTNLKNEDIIETEDGIKERGGLVISDSERPLSIGGTDLISANLFEKFDYVALGHLHGAQKVFGDKIRYSGSPLKYSFSEVKQKKSVTILDVKDKNNINIYLRELKPIRDMRVIKGPLDKLLDEGVYSGTNVNDYISANITDKGEIMDIMSKLKAIYPRILEIRRDVFLGEGAENLNKAHNHKNKSKIELFNEFYNDMTGEDLEEEKLEVMKKVIESIEEGRY